MDISISNVSVSWPGQPKPFFSIKNLTIPQGQHLLIQGPSGRGKTTFLHLLAGLFTPHEGQICIGDAHLTKQSEDERALFRRRSMGIIFQKLNLVEHMTPLENIELSLRDQHNTQKALAALKAVGLEGREHDRTALLSLGEQQRVAVARVLARHPQIVLADEPTSSLDEKNAFEVIQLLIDSCQKKTLVVVSHDHRIEKYFSAVVDFGKIIA